MNIGGLAGEFIWSIGSHRVSGQNFMHLPLIQKVFIPKSSIHEVFHLQNIAGQHLHSIYYIHRSAGVRLLDGPRPHNSWKFSWNSLIPGPRKTNDWPGDSIPWLLASVASDRQKTDDRWQWVKAMELVLSLCIFHLLNWLATKEDLSSWTEFSKRGHAGTKGIMRMLGGTTNCCTSSNHHRDSFTCDHLFFYRPAHNMFEDLEVCSQT